MNSHSLKRPWYGSSVVVMVAVITIVAILTYINVYWSLPPPEVVTQVSIVKDVVYVEKPVMTVSLSQILTDDSRKKCKKRYPKGLTISEEQAAFLSSQKYFIVVTLRNNQNSLHHLLYEILTFVEKVGPQNVFISVFENNSNDLTPMFLALFEDILTLVDIPHHIVSTMNWEDEIKETKDEIETKLKSPSKAEASTKRSVLVEEMRRLHPSDASSIFDYIERNFKEEMSKPVSAPRNLNNVHSLANISDYAKEMLLKTAGDISAFNTRWEGNRIEFLAKVRNWSVRPIWEETTRYDRIVFLNDVIFCGEDILRLALRGEADAMCGLDFDTTREHGVGFYDTWVARDAEGNHFDKRPPMVRIPEHSALLQKGRPFPVFCCWNGLVVAKAAPFYDDHFSFRRGRGNECWPSECTLFCLDYWRAGYYKFAIDPHVRLAYDDETYESLHSVNWLHPSDPNFQGPETVQESSIPWNPNLKSHNCCGLKGNGRDPDQPCFREAIHPLLQL